MGLPRVSETTKERIRERIDMVQLVSEYVTLTQKGTGDFWGRCPFHEEKSASFHILPAKGIFKCFGCGKGGDVFRFVEEMEGIGFGEALRRLAERAGVQLEDETPADRERQERRAALFRASALVGEFFAQVLASPTPAGERGRAYLAERGITAETAQAFGIGVAPPEYDALTSYARERRINEEVLIELGLLRRPRDGHGRPYAFFRDRLMFPIRSEQGKVVGFGGRTLGDDERKYMNSPEVPGLYEKRKLLYGLDRAKSSRPRPTRLVVVEGYMDVVIPHQEGHTAFVAALGTAFTPEQARLAKRYVDEVVLLFDGDEAGTNATLRALANLVGEDGLTVRVARLPDGMDPDEAVRKDPRLLEQSLEAADDLVTFIIDQTLVGYEVASPAGQERAVRAAIKLLAKIPDRIRLFRELGQVAHRFGIPERVLRDELATAAKRAAEPRRAYPAPEASFHPAEPAEAPVPRAELAVLESLLAVPDAAAAVAAVGGGPQSFTPGPALRIAAAIFAVAGEGLVSAPAVLDRLNDPAARAVCGELIGRIRSDKSYDDYQEAFSAIDERQRKQRLRQLTRAMRDAADPETKKSLLQEYQQLKNHHPSLRTAPRTASAGADPNLSPLTNA